MKNKFLRIGVFLILSLVSISERDVLADDSGSEIVELKVLFMYTPEAVAFAGSHEAIVAETNSWIDDTNEALSLSRALIRYVSAYVDFIDVSEEGRTSLELLNDVKSDPDFQRWFRDYETVIQVIVTEKDSTSHGFDELQWGSFSKVGYRHGSWHFAHEVGHTLGLSHSRDNPNHYDPKIAKFRYGFSYEGLTEEKKSVMTASQQPMFFSNPRLILDGLPAGIEHLDDPENSADCVRGLNLSADYWRNFNPDVGLKRSLNTTFTKMYGPAYDPVVAVTSVFHVSSSDANGLTMVLEREVPRCGGENWEVADEAVVEDSDQLPLLIDRDPGVSCYYRTYFINTLGEKVGHSKPAYPRFSVADINEDDMVDDEDLALYDADPMDVNLDGIIDSQDRDDLITWLDDQRCELRPILEPVKLYGPHDAILTQVLFTLPEGESAIDRRFVLERNVGSGWEFVADALALDETLPVFLDETLGTYDSGVSYQYRIYIVEPDGRRCRWSEPVTATPAVDVNEDGNITLLDYLAAIANPFDVNLDGLINGNDRIDFFTWSVELE